MTEENVIKRWFVVNLYAETQLETVAGFDNPPKHLTQCYLSIQKKLEVYVFVCFQHFIRTATFYPFMLQLHTEKHDRSSALLRREEQLS